MFKLYLFGVFDSLTLYFRAGLQDVGLLILVPFRKRWFGVTLFEYKFKLMIVTFFSFPRTDRVAVITHEKAALEAFNGVAFIGLEIDKLEEDTADGPHIDLGVVVLFE
jgi:hypothetical protein